MCMCGTHLFTSMQPGMAYMSKPEQRWCLAATVVRMPLQCDHCAQQTAHVAGEVRAPISSIAHLPMNERKVIAHRTMLMIDRPHAIVNLGIGMPEVCFAHDCLQHLMLSVRH